ncbi:AbrB/MazE/SpoVT family DNA-binding domain-containing protein [Salibacterium lacus]|uniref:AbrB/MazE/SpoVT family DNA-binding domain-containing protein n=1 Tax=Salibacterium lacus TaxID=1898109 RepID=A0ABW5T3V0_9BACI
MSGKESRKVSQTGNSLSVGLPKSITDSLKIKRGDEIEFEVHDNQLVLTKKRKWEEEVDAEMLDMLAETFEEHHDVFENLKDR